MVDKVDSTSCRSELSYWTVFMRASMSASLLRVVWRAAAAANFLLGGSNGVCGGLSLSSSTLARSYEI